MLEFGFIAADTSRSRIYLNALRLGNLRPSLVILVPSSVEGAAGMVGRDDEYLLDDPEWPEAKVDLRVGLTRLLDSFGYHYVSLSNSDINDPAVVDYFQIRKWNCLFILEVRRFYFESPNLIFG